MSTRIYIIGSGVISHHHAQACGELAGSELHAADPSPEARASFLEAFPHAHLYERSEEMLATAAGPDDLVVVSTPPRWHVSEAEKALASGRSVLVEKPLAMDLAEAEALWASAQAKGLHIATCGSRFQSWTLNQLAKQKINDGSIGTPYLVDWIHRTECHRTGIEYQNGSWWFLDKSKSGGGPLMDWGPYDWNTLLSIFEPKEVQVLQSSCTQPSVPADLPEGTVYDIETQVVATVRFVRADDSLVDLRYERSCATHGEAEQREGIYGTDAFLSWNWLPFGEDLSLKVKISKDKESSSVEEISAEASEAPNWMFEPLLQFRSYVQGKNDAVGMFDAKALQAFQVIQAIYESSESKQPVVLTF